MQEGGPRYFRLCLRQFVETSYQRLSEASDSGLSDVITRPVMPQPADDQPAERRIWTAPYCATPQRPTGNQNAVPRRSTDGFSLQEKAGAAVALHGQIGACEMGLNWDHANRPVSKARPDRVDPSSGAPYNGGTWTHHRYEAGETVDLTSIGAQVPVASGYRWSTVPVTLR